MKQRRITRYSATLKEITAVLDVEAQLMHARCVAMASARRAMGLQLSF